MGHLDSSKSQTSHRAKQRPVTGIYVFPILILLLVEALSFESRCLHLMLLCLGTGFVYPTPSLPFILNLTHYKHLYPFPLQPRALLKLFLDSISKNTGQNQERPLGAKMVHRPMKWQRASDTVILVTAFLHFHSLACSPLTKVQKISLQD